MSAASSLRPPILETAQRAAFRYFPGETNSANGLVRDKTARNWPASIAATGMALSANLVGVERGFLSRQAAVTMTLKTLRFFHQSPQGPEPDASGYRGFYYHFLDMRTGRRAWKCELSTIDTALLLAGVLSASQYFDADNGSEREIRELADVLYRRVDWRWAQNNGATITHGWTPENGFLSHRWEGYDEALLLYILALGSPSHAVNVDTYGAWSSTYQWIHAYGYEYLYAGPLFTHQLPHIWIDFHGIQDAFMREHGIDYVENSRRATSVQRRYAIHNPLGFDAYCSHCWGLTACDGPGPAVRELNGVTREFFDYVARGVPHGPDDGTLAPWVVIASLPFAPEIVLPAIDYCAGQTHLADFSRYGFKASFNPSFKCRNSAGWVSAWHYGINQGPIVMMIENHRSGLLWQLMRHCRYIASGLRRAGFRGGWL